VHAGCKFTFIIRTLSSLQLHLLTSKNQVQPLYMMLHSKESEMRYYPLKNRFYAIEVVFMITFYCEDTMP